VHKICCFLDDAEQGYGKRDIQINQEQPLDVIAVILNEQVEKRGAYDDTDTLFQK